MADDNIPVAKPQRRNVTIKGGVAIATPPPVSTNPSELPNFGASSVKENNKHVTINSGGGIFKKRIEGR